jgi:hypothetical protein
MKKQKLKIETYSQLGLFGEERTVKGAQCRIDDPLFVTICANGSTVAQAKHRVKKVVDLIKKSGLLAIVFLLASCTTYKPTARDIDNATKATLIKGPEHTLRGWKYIFLTAAGDTVTRYSQRRYTGYTCYLLF